MSIAMLRCNRGWPHNEGVDEKVEQELAEVGAIALRVKRRNAANERDEKEIRERLPALRDIQTGEEICYDYSTTMDEKSFTMHCRCGAPGCRRVVTDFSELPAAVQDFYISRGLVDRK